MTIKEFLVGQANEIVSEFKDIRVRITYNDLSDVHFLEIHPQSEYNDELKLSLSYILDDFYTIFPNESLSFVTAKDLIESNPEDQWVEDNTANLDWVLWFNGASLSGGSEPIECGDLYYIAA